MLLAVAAILGGWFGSEMIRAQRQRAVVRAIWSLGGYVGRELERPRADPVVPSWHRSLLGRDFMDPVVVVRLAGTDADDEDLIGIGRLSHLRMLDLRDTRITDAGLRHLRGLSGLRLLILTGTGVSDEGLAQLKDIPQLEVLCLEETSITDKGLAHLKAMGNLGWLNLSGTRISDAGVVHLRECPWVEVMILDGCALSEEGLSELQRASPHRKVFDGSNRHPFLEYTYW